MVMRKGVDFLVIGGGPDGHRAAIEAGRAGSSVLLVEQGPVLGGECVARGTIPSKTLRETATYLAGLRDRCEGVLDVELAADTKVAGLMGRMKAVRENHETYMNAQVDCSSIDRLHGRVSFLGPHKVEVSLRDGGRKKVTARHVIIATGSRPRDPENVPIDHELILDSDSILSLMYLPRTLAVLGSGVIACEFASIFAAIGVQVTMIDKRVRPLDFLDPELSDEFLRSFEERGGTYIGSAGWESVEADGYEVRIDLGSGEVHKFDKCLCALGRVANVDDLNLSAAGIDLDEKGVIPVDEFGRTETPSIYAVGDVVGPPALAATAVMQGRNAVRHALDMSIGDTSNQTPTGIYTIPDIASIGLTEGEARERHGEVFVGRASFAEVTKGQISGNEHGFLKLIVSTEGYILGAQIAGEGATELIHLAQMAMFANLTVDAFLQNAFNFPTLAEAYRVAALSVSSQIVQRQRAG